VGDLQILPMQTKSTEYLALVSMAACLMAAGSGTLLTSP
jgi:hypothetical protein